MAELADAGVNLGALSRPTDSRGSPATQAFEAVRDAKVLSSDPCRRLLQAHCARTRIEHSYVQTPACDVHSAAILVRDAARDFIGSYRARIELC